MMSLFFLVSLALILDYLLSETPRFHPLVGFGRWASHCEARLNAKTDQPKGNGHFLPVANQRFRGMFCWLLVVLPCLCLFIVIGHWVSHWPAISACFSAFVLYLALGWKSLLTHAEAVRLPLQAMLGPYGEYAADNPDAGATTSDAIEPKPELLEARRRVGFIVSRDTQSLNPDALIKATTESVLENGADAIFAAIFWFCIAGVPGVVLYRLSNTLDAMWGYKTSRFHDFGWFAARFDDTLNWMPARLTALSYALVAPWVQGSSVQALRSWRRQGRYWKSPNAGPVMAAGAGALGVSLGGGASYQGTFVKQPVLGVDPLQSKPLTPDTLRKACRLLNAALCLWVLVLLILAVGC